MNEKTRFTKILSHQEANEEVEVNLKLMQRFQFFS